MKPQPPTNWLTVLHAARNGSKEALGELLEDHRALLLLLAHQALSPQLQGKAGASDLVQDTFIDAVDYFHGFQGQTRTEFKQWLKTILDHNALDFARRYRQSAKRNITCERSSGQTCDLDNLPDSRCTLRTSKGELLEVLENARWRLSADDNLLITFRLQEQLSFPEIAERLRCTECAARQRWARALQRWRQEAMVDHDNPNLGNSTHTP